MKILLIISMLFLCSCDNRNNLIEIEVISTYRNNGSWNAPFSHMIVERTDTKERIWYPIIIGKDGDIFTIKEKDLYIKY